MKRLKIKKWQKTFKIFCLLVFSLSLLSCLSWVLEKPTFVLREISLSPRSFTEMNLLLGLEVQNPNRLDFTLSSVEYILYLNNKEIGTGRLEKELLIPSLSTSRVQAPIVAKFKDLGEILKTIVTTDDISYKIEGKANVKTVFGNLNFPFSKEGRINLKK